MPFELTPEEQAHRNSLDAVLAGLHSISADPATPADIRQDVQLHMIRIRGEIDEIDQGAFHRGTVDINAAAELLHPALQELDSLKADLARIGARIQMAADVASAVDQAITTGKSLLA